MTISTTSGGDCQWWVEACRSTGYGNAIAGFHTVRDFINGPVIRGSGLLTIQKYRDNVLGGGTNPGAARFYRLAVQPPR